jgi:hypothetical protein
MRRGTYDVAWERVEEEVKTMLEHETKGDVPVGHFYHVHPPGTPRVDLTRGALMTPAPQLASGWYKPPAKILNDLRRSHPQWVTPLRPIYEAVEESLRGRRRRAWRMCPLCGRVFPALRKTKTCAVCRLQWTRREIQWRLRGVPRDPVVFLQFPDPSPTSPGMGRSNVYLYVRRGVDAPKALLDAMPPFLREYREQAVRRATGSPKIRGMD